MRHGDDSDDSLCDGSLCGFEVDKVPVVQSRNDMEAPFNFKKESFKVIMRRWTRGELRIRKQTVRFTQEGYPLGIVLGTRGLRPPPPIKDSESPEDSNKPPKKKSPEDTPVFLCVLEVVAGGQADMMGLEAGCTLAKAQDIDASKFVNDPELLKKTLSLRPLSLVFDYWGRQKLEATAMK